MPLVEFEIAHQLLTDIIIQYRQQLIVDSGY